MCHFEHYFDRASHLYLRPVFTSLPSHLPTFTPPYLSTSLPSRLLFARHARSLAMEDVLRDEISTTTTTEQPLNSYYHCTFTSLLRWTYMYNPEVRTRTLA